MIKRFLAIIDTSSLDNDNMPFTLSRALQLATCKETEVYLLVCLHFPVIDATSLLSPAQSDDIRHALTLHYRNKLQMLTNKFSRPGVHFNYDVVWKSPPYRCIIAKITTFQPDLVLKQVNEKSTHSRCLTNATDIQLMKESIVPVLLVKQETLAASRPVLAALDPVHRLNSRNQLDNRVLETAGDIATQLTTPLHAIHCFDPDYWEILFESLRSAEIWADIFPASHQEKPRIVLDALKEQHHEAFTHACRNIVTSPEHLHMVEGSTIETLTRSVAELNAGILVVGTTYRTGLLGSTAETLADTIDCDVLVVKPIDFAEYIEPH